MAPEPADYSAKEIRNCPSPPVSIQNILAFIKELHKAPREYTIDENDIDLADEIFNLYRSLVKWANRHDFYLG